MDTLDDLFARLRVATAPAEIEALQEGIWQIWLTTGHPLLDKHLEAGMRYLSAEDYTLAIREFTELIETSPDYAEGWNKRATAYYLRGEYRASLLDIQQTLRREPRHFGALSGWATIVRMLGDDAGTLRVWQRLNACVPTGQGCKPKCATCATVSTRPTEFNASL
ncbi:tetratricopeptide repeat protein [Hymenobacter sp. AT01-02]|uniref:tetratricopeptide repeat protein n=1 Tax=Hymenobacter sp. AT01-02 TaxID=1571877 RepID=UPI0006966EB6|nr:tetratricopeptide repeat protein [Hymenobacter sp. AT01-02]